MNRIYQFIADLPAYKTLIGGWASLLAPPAIVGSVSQKLSHPTLYQVLLTASVALGMVLTTVIIIIKIHQHIAWVKDRRRNRSRLP